MNQRRRRDSSNRRGRARGSLRALLSVVALLAAPPLALLGGAPVARATTSSAYADVLHAYQSSGIVPACRFSATELQSALKGIDTYGAQYFADFASAVQTALAQRASGACSRTGRQTGASLSHLRAGPGATSSELRGPVAPATSAGIPLALLLLAIAGGLFLLVAATAALWRRRGWHPGWAATWGHAWGEAGYRAAAVWLDFVDWARAGDR